MNVRRIFFTCYLYKHLRQKEKNVVQNFEPKTKTKDWKITV